MESFVTWCYILFCFNLMGYIKIIYTHYLENLKPLLQLTQRKYTGTFGGPLDTPLKFKSTKF